MIRLVLIFAASVQLLHAGPINNPKVTWKFQSGAPIRGAVTVTDSQLYFGNSEGSIFCLDKRTGKVIWTYKTDGSICSQPAVSGQVAVFSGRSKFIYALNPGTGKLLWKFEMQSFGPHKWGWDFYESSPVISGGRVYVGSGDQNLYALDVKDGKLLWKFQTGNKIRATPQVHHGTVYVPSFDGFVYALNPDTGEEKWRFETDGVKLDSDKSGWDRCSISSRPAIEDSTMVFGSRDGNVYGVSLSSHKARWKFTYGPSWCLASPAIDGNTVYIGWSDAKQFCAIDLITGKQKWRYDLHSLSFSSPVVDESNVYVGASSGKFYSFDKSNGSPKWEFKTSGSVFSSPVFSDGKLYFGSDDGMLYAIEEGDKVYRGVFQESKFKNQYIEEGMLADPKIGPYFESQGYTRLDSGKLYQFLSDRIQDKARSVIVFSQEYIPSNILGPNGKDNMLRKYMETGGKIVWTGQAINWLKVDQKGDFTGGNSPGYANELLDMTFDLADESGIYFARATALGLQWGLPKTFNSNYAMVADKNIFVLAYNELGRPTAWFRHIGSRTYSGFVNLRTWGFLGTGATQEDLELLLTVAEYGL